MASASWGCDSCLSALAVETHAVDKPLSMLSLVFAKNAYRACEREGRRLESDKLAVLVAFHRRALGGREEWKRAYRTTAHVHARFATPAARALSDATWAHIHASTRRQVRAALPWHKQFVFAFADVLDQGIERVAGRHTYPAATVDLSEKDWLERALDKRARDD
jgi:hypothetical protein